LAQAIHNQESDLTTRSHFRASQRKLAEKQADLDSRKAALVEVLADNQGLRERIASQPLARSDVNRLLAAR
jgi:hypothetical protein